MQEQEKNIINLNRAKLSANQIKEKENLDSVLNNHKMITKRPVYKRKRFYFFLFLLLVITLLLYYVDKEEENNRTPKTEQTN